MKGNNNKDLREQESQRIKKFRKKYAARDVISEKSEYSKASEMSFVGRKGAEINKDDLFFESNDSMEFMDQVDDVF